MFNVICEWIEFIKTVKRYVCTVSRISPSNGTLNAQLSHLNKYWTYVEQWVLIFSDNEFYLIPCGVGAKANESLFDKEQFSILMVDTFHQTIREIDSVSALKHVTASLCSVTEEHKHYRRAIELGLTLGIWLPEGDHKIDADLLNPEQALPFFKSQENPVMVKFCESAISRSREIASSQWERGGR